MRSSLFQEEPLSMTCIGREDIEALTESGEREELVREPGESSTEDSRLGGAKIKGWFRETLDIDVS
jgi:hypothetical protein